MNESTILNNFLSFVTPNMHKVRRNSLALSIDSVMRGRCATVTGIGRNIDADSYEKHRIKQADRLLSNKHLQNEQASIYQVLTLHIACISTRPVILIDWSDMDEYKGNFLLRASVAFEGRGIAIYQELHDMSTREKTPTHNRFLDKLHSFMKPGCRPIIVSDAGFKTPFFRKIESLGWDYVGRIRGRMVYSTDKNDWQGVTELHSDATQKAKAKCGYLNKRNPTACRIISYKGRSKGRHSYTKFGNKCSSTHSKKRAKAANEPWVLATSLPMTTSLPKQVVRIYRKRMQIEEEFRDIKSRLYGLGFELHKSYITKRVAILILIATLASIILTLLGLAMHSARIRKRYQANTVKKKRVLSFHFLGMRGIADKYLRISHENIMRAIAQLHVIIRKNSPNEY